MTTRDIQNTLSPALSLNPAARTASANGTTVDLQGYGAAMITFSFGTWTDGTHTPSVQHSADGTTFTTCDSNSLSGTLSAVSSSAGNGTVQKVGYTGGYRYIRAVMTVTGATTGALSTASVIRGRATQQPV